MQLDIIEPLQCSDLSPVLFPMEEVHLLISLVDVCQCLITKQKCFGIPRSHLKYVLWSRLRLSFPWMCLAPDQPINLPKWRSGLFEIPFVTFSPPVVSIREQWLRGDA